MIKGKNRVLGPVIFLLLASFFYGTSPGIQEFLFLIVISVLLMISAFLFRHYYRMDENPLRHRVISICMTFVLASIFYVAVKEFGGFTLDYSLIVTVFIGLSIITLWESFNLTMLEKVVLVSTLFAIFGVRIYERAVTIPSTAFQVYQSELSKVTSFEAMQDLLLEDYRENINPKDFQDLEPYLQQFPLRNHQPALFEFEDGQIIMVEVDDSREEHDKSLKVSKIELLPEEIAEYFRYYPLEIERKADFPKGKEVNDEIIETRGAFVSRASFQQERDWYDQLISVFGKKEVWDELWVDLEGLRAPEGPLLGSGTNSEGYLEFRFSEDWKVDEEVLDEIYVLFQDKASKNNITELPVVFKWYRPS